MRSIFRTALLAAATLSFTAMAEFDPKTNTDGQIPGPMTDISLKTPIPLGCYSSPGKMFDMGVYLYQSPGWCQALCTRLAKTYFSNVNGTNCFCGDAPPSNTYKVDNSSCDTPCSGTDTTLCGGTNLWDVQNGRYQIGDLTGTQKITIPAPTYTWTPPAAATTSSSSTTGPSTVVVTQPPTTAPVESTQTPTPQASSGPNTAAIAAGVVVGIVLLTAGVGGIFFFMRRRKQQALVEEQRRHEMMTSFVTGEKPRSGYTSPDSRLDPSLMFQRRLSDGSIRDNEDYSRRILKVANPDD